MDEHKKLLVRYKNMKSRKNLTFNDDNSEPNKEKEFYDALLETTEIIILGIIHHNHSKFNLSYFPYFPYFYNIYCYGGKFLVSESPRKDVSLFL